MMNSCTVLAASSIDQHTKLYTKLDENIEEELKETIHPDLIEIKNIPNSNLQSPSNKTPKSTRKPLLSMIRTRGSVIKSADSFLTSSSPSGKEFVYTLHQNNKSILIYGYLSLLQESQGNVIVKWTPNELMNLTPKASKHNTNTAFPFTATPMDILCMAKHIISFHMKTISYIHVHHNDESSLFTLDFVDIDGTQLASFAFCSSMYLVNFMAALEGAIDPYQKLNPPLSGNDKNSFEKTLPKLKKKISTVAIRLSLGSLSSSETEGLPVNDYVFRVETTSYARRKKFDESGKKAEEGGFATNNNHEGPKSAPAIFNIKKLNCSTDSDSINENMNTNINNAYSFMKQKILSRAFSGWFNHCKQVKTVRNHLSGVINPEPIECFQKDSLVRGVVDEEYFNYIRQNKQNKNLWSQFLKRVYYDGISQSVRAKAWPYLLQIIEWEDEIEDVIQEINNKYNKHVDSWQEIESVVVQRDKEAFLAARLKHTSAATTNSECCDSETQSVSSFKNDGSVFSELFNDDYDAKKDTVFENNCHNATNEEEEALINNFGANLHRVEKDVERCDRNHTFFKSQSNLDKLKRVMCTYVWRNLNEGYVQGMCDIAAPLLVIFEDEVIVLEIFSKLMERMHLNFPQEIGMDINFANFRHLIQITDPELFETIMAEGDFTHLYFSYRWFLLDFKRELPYEEVYSLWETIWASNLTLSNHFQLFFALSLLTTYRYIILENSMDFTDVIKFFNEMAEKHDGLKLIESARDHLQDFRRFFVESAVLKSGTED